jgi:hypothetical protein
MFVGGTQAGCTGDARGDAASGVADLIRGALPGEAEGDADGAKLSTTATDSNAVACGGGGRS